MSFLDAQEEFVLTNPLAYFFGHASLSENPELFRHQLQQLASAVKRRMESDAEGALMSSLSTVASFI